MVTYFQDTLFFNAGELTAPGTTPSVSVYENNYFSTKNYSLVATVSNIDTNVVVRLDGSIDGTHYGPIISNTITENGTFVYKASNIPVKFVRANFYKETGGTNAIVRLSFSAQ